MFVHSFTLPLLLLSLPRYTLPNAMKLRPILLSALLLIPVFWHHHIEAGDLGSHVYNAWLAQLVQKGTAPGVYAVWQWNNVLFDLLLLSLSNLFGIPAAEKISVAFCVLLFFWSIFALMAVATRRSPWLLTPFIAMLTYGYVFHMGFMNYYLSIALACLGLSLLWSGRPKLQLVSLPIIPLMLLAHPLGALWFLGAAAYWLLWRHLPRWRIAFPVLGLLLILAVRWFISHHSAYEFSWPDHPFYFFNGADQFVIFGERYRYISAIVFAFGLLMAGLDLRRASRAVSWWKDRLLLLEFCVIAFCVTSLLPENLRLNQGTGWIGLLVSRLTLITAIYALCLLGSLTPQRWHLAALSACALLFFVFLYQDTSLVARLEANAEKLTRNLPFGTRVLKTVAALLIGAPRSSTIPLTAPASATASLSPTTNPPPNNSASASMMTALSRSSIPTTANPWNPANTKSSPKISPSSKSISAIPPTPPPSACAISPPTKKTAASPITPSS